MSTFQPRPGDACKWVADAAFFDFDDELEEQDLTLQDLQTGYEVMQIAFTEAKIPFAAIGDFALSILGGREDLTHYIGFQINGTPVELFTKLRTMDKLRLKIGLQADTFRIHCNIGVNKWVAVDILMTSKNNVNEMSGEYKGVKMLNITPLLQTKLKSFAACSTAVRDTLDIMYLVEMHTAAIDASKLDQTQVNFFLANAELEGKAERRAEKVLKLV